jgi:chromosome segregation ATPase
MNEMKELNSKIENAEKESGKAIEESKAMKLKLQESFKEFIAIDGTMKQLRKEAIKGTDAVEARNVMLQKNLTKLTADFEITSKELRTSNSKTRELEYELEQMIKELNSKGEALKKSTQMNSNLKANLEATTNELRELQQNHEQLILQKAKIEADARQDNINNEHQKQDLRKTLKKTSEELNQVAAEKLDLEMVIRTNKQEIETLKKQVKTYSTEKDDLTISLNNTKKLYQTDMAIREQKISELNNRIAKDQVTLKAVQEKKEQLMFEVTDLQNNLSSETDIVKSLTGDLAQLKRTTEEKINLLNEQIEKLNVTKNNLVNDKKELGEKIKSCRQELRQRDEELEETIKKFEDFQTNSGSEIAGLDRKLKSSQEDNRILNKAHDDLKGRYTDSVKENVGLKREREQLQRKQTEKELAIATSTIQALVADKDELIKNLEMSRKQGDDLETRIKTSLERNNSVYSEYTAYKKNAETVMEDQTVEIRRLKEDLMETHGHNKLLTYKKTQLEKSLADTETKLSETSSKLITETKTREILEEQLDQNRIAYMNEKRMRVELERVQTHIKYNDASRVIGSWSEWKTRDRKLADLAIGLVQESSRLTQLVNLLPVKDGFGNETEFEWPNDIPAGAKKKKL